MKVLKKILVVMLVIVTLVGCGKKENKKTEFELPKNSGVWYEIFVRAFADSDGDGIGDFKGLTAKLDYLSDLGISGLWLMPINESPSYHQYDVTDYYAVDPDYGTMEDFEAFIAACKEKKIEVIIDLVVNHSSSEHPWFVDASKGVDSEYRDYYRWVDDDAEGINVGDRWYKNGGQYYFAHFWDKMPDLNFDSQAVRDEVKNIAKFWLDKGVSGFRMDAAMHIYTTNELKKGSNLLAPNQEWWAEFDAYCKEINPDYYLIGEVWADAKTRSFYTESFASLFNFDVGNDSIIPIVKNGKDTGFNATVQKAIDYYAKGNPDFVDAPFLTNHDQARVMTFFAGDEMKAKLAATMYLTLPGNPFLYYGEEIGMQGDKPDEYIREPLPWGDEYTTTWVESKYNVDLLTVANQSRFDSSLLGHYKQIIDVRNNSEALSLGNFVGIETENNKLVAYSRNSEDVSCIVLHNVSDTEQVISLDKLGITDKAELLFNSNAMFKYAFGTEITLPAYTSIILQQDIVEAKK
ncbi:MAG: hypothetical protein K0R15_1906 [Clostridiales bacterium]|jgi:glycosidase|nr:hypothetical protein [Clostridiales bacterium]